jgi:hypothetical protein
MKTEMLAFLLPVLFAKETPAFFHSLTAKGKNFCYIL